MQMGLMHIILLSVRVMHVMRQKAGGQVVTIMLLVLFIGRICQIQQGIISIFIYAPAVLIINVVQSEMHSNLNAVGLINTL